MAVILEQSLGARNQVGIGLSFLGKISFLNTVRNRETMNILFLLMLRALNGYIW
jgi:hypothetical protein